MGGSENHRKAKFYRLTRAGRKQLEAEARNWEQATAILARFLSPAAAVAAAALAAEALARPRSTSRTQRKPMLLFLLSGSFLLRLAARRFLVSLLNEPPRNTRTLDCTPFPDGDELPRRRAGLEPRAG